ncbi:hypothetical protein E5288_WYG007592 [Bos mutus]|uniref:Uncharacterized protein n=1 Tax=Bos mutus TaxID=72004 RepID=A0A6B0RGA0_9CETA|nr:hypothetical protein [Bos mutus]
MMDINEGPGNFISTSLNRSLETAAAFTSSARLLQVVDIILTDDHVLAGTPASSSTPEETFVHASTINILNQLKHEHVCSQLKPLQQVEFVFIEVASRFSDSVQMLNKICEMHGQKAKECGTPTVLVTFANDRQKDSKASINITIDNDTVYTMCLRRKPSLFGNSPKSIILAGSLDFRKVKTEVVSE